MRRPVALLVLGALSATAAGPPPAESAATPPTESRLPLTISNLWYRAEGKRREGHLTVDREGLEFVAKKQAFSIPLDTIQFISYGTTARDVDTDWVMLSLGEKPPYEVVGFRDGAKLGFGGRTQQIYDTLRRAMKELKAAQYRAPAGQRVHEDPEHRAAFLVPEGWHTYVDSFVQQSGTSRTATAVLSEAEIRRMEKQAEGPPRAVDDLAQLDAVLAGERAGFTFEQREAGRGATCASLTDGARRAALELALADPIHSQPFTPAGEPQATDVELGGCLALRIVGKSRRADGTEVVLELHIVARDQTLYAFRLHALADRYERFREPYAAALASLKFGAALAS